MFWCDVKVFWFPYKQISSLGAIFGCVAWEATCTTIVTVTKLVHTRIFSPETLSNPFYSSFSFSLFISYSLCIPFFLWPTVVDNDETAALWLVNLFRVDNRNRLFTRYERPKRTNSGTKIRKNNFKRKGKKG